MRIAQQPTAIDACHAHEAAGLSSHQRAVIVRFIEINGGSWSIGELAGALGMQKSTISARLNECLNDFGLLVEKPRRKDRLSNITIRPVGLPAKQLDLLQ
jgi:hypothetical protein